MDAEQIFSRAREIDDPEVGLAFIEGACQGDEGKRANVGTLLAAREEMKESDAVDCRADGFLPGWKYHRLLDVGLYPDPLARAVMGGDCRRRGAAERHGNLTNSIFKAFQSMSIIMET